MSDIRIGYGYDFVSNLHHSQYCPICTFVLKNAVQIKSCGHAVCKNCLEDWLNTLSPENLRCPVDNVPIRREDVFDDKRLNREIKSRNVYCEQSHVGCKATPELSDYNAHLKSCGYVMVTCPLKCGQSLQRQALDDHKLRCPYRMVPLKELNAVRKRLEKVERENEDVERSTKRIKLECETLTDEINRSREKIDSLKRENAALKQDSIQSKDTIERLEMETDRASGRRKMDALGVKIQNLFMTHGVESNADVFTCAFNFTQTGEAKKGVVIDGPTFYTHPGGYKLGIMAECTSDAPGSASWLLRCHLMRGDHDAGLTWPWAGTETIVISDDRGRDLAVYRPVEGGAGRSRPVLCMNCAPLIRAGYLFLPGVTYTATVIK